jgi:hypothetical protein
MVFILVSPVGWWLRVKPGLHDSYLVLLFGDDAERQIANSGILGIEQHGLGHVDRALMVRHHHGDEVMLADAVHRRLAHAGVHDGHGVVY